MEELKDGEGKLIGWVDHSETNLKYRFEDNVIYVNDDGKTFQFPFNSKTIFRMHESKNTMIIHAYYDEKCFEVLYYKGLFGILGEYLRLLFDKQTIFGTLLGPNDILCVDLKGKLRFVDLTCRQILPFEINFENKAHLIDVFEKTLDLFCDRTDAHIFDKSGNLVLTSVSIS